MCLEGGITSTSVNRKKKDSTPFGYQERKETSNLCCLQGMPSLRDNGKNIESVMTAIIAACLHNQPLKWKGS